MLRVYLVAFEAYPLFSPQSHDAHRISGGGSLVPIAATVAASTPRAAARTSAIIAASGSGGAAAAVSTSATAVAVSSAGATAAARTSSTTAAASSSVTSSYAVNEPLSVIVPWSDVLALNWVAFPLRLIVGDPLRNFSIVFASGFNPTWLFCCLRPLL